MDTTLKVVGRQAAVAKYDLITAVGAWALSGSKHEHRLALRFIALVTARYNWQRDHLAIGQREIASLWSCDERTVKREIARLKALGWLVLKVRGRRGQVAQYGLDLSAIFETTRAVWPRIGPDFVLRQDQSPANNVVPLRPNAPVPPPDVTAGDEWALGAALLHQQDPATYAAWIKALQREGRAGGQLTLRAPSRFHAAYVETHLKPRLLAACRAVDEAVEEILLVF